ncbi:hypothetical protein VNO77_06018 [Canavalia gladiata]|uniref:Uncharacterized protein n=1 Tax=Canavalia gladiata TaxID=3824 RepID=A0AAN9RAI8_CANGL
MCVDFKRQGAIILYTSRPCRLKGPWDACKSNEKVVISRWFSLPLHHHPKFVPTSQFSDTLDMDPQARIFSLALSVTIFGILVILPINRGLFQVSFMEEEAQSKQISCVGPLTKSKL